MVTKCGNSLCSKPANERFLSVSTTYDLIRVMRKTAFGVFDQVRHIRARTSLEDDKRLEISYLGHRRIVHSM